jgi:hypothetical protein
VIGVAAEGSDVLDEDFFDTDTTLRTIPDVFTGPPFDYKCGAFGGHSHSQTQPSSRMLQFSTKLVLWRAAAAGNRRQTSLSFLLSVDRLTDRFFTGHERFKHHNFVCGWSVLVHSLVLICWLTVFWGVQPHLRCTRILQTRKLGYRTQRWSSFGLFGPCECLKSIYAFLLIFNDVCFSQPGSTSGRSGRVTQWNTCTPKCTLVDGAGVGDMKEGVSGFLTSLAGC